MDVRLLVAEGVLCLAALACGSSSTAPAVAASARWDAATYVATLSPDSSRVTFTPSPMVTLDPGSVGWSPIGPSASFQPAGSCGGIGPGPTFGSNTILGPAGTVSVVTRPTALTICPDGLGYYHRGTYALKVTENYPNGSASANATLIVR